VDETAVDLKAAVRNAVPWRALAGGLAAFAALHAAAALVPGLVATAFCRPAAWLASCYFGAPVLFDADGAVLVRPQGDVMIHAACSGFQFFALLSALAVFALLDGGPSRRRRLALAASVPAAYLVTLAANGCRIVAVVAGSTLTDGLLPQDVLNSLHTGIGVAVFLPVLVAAYYALSRKVRPVHVHA
jgi:exosortase K